MKPVSPSHSLQYINANMQTEEILRSMHEWMIPRRKEIDEGKRKHEAPLITLRLAIKSVLKMVEKGEIVPLYPNPFNEKTSIRLNLDMEKATKYDIKLLKKQLKELDKIYQELDESGYWNRQKSL